MFELPTTCESPQTGARYVQALSMVTDQLDLKTGTQVRTEAMEYVLGRARTVKTSEVDQLARLVDEHDLMWFLPAELDALGGPDHD